MFFSVGSTRVIVEGAACTTFWPLKGLWKCDPSWNVKINCLVTNPQEEEGSQMVSTRVHRPKSTSLSHCFHVTSKRVVKSKNWGRKEWFLSIAETNSLHFPLEAGNELFSLLLAIQGRKYCADRILSVCLLKQKNTFLATLRSACLPFFKFCSWIHWADAILDYEYVSHLFGRVNQVLYDSLGLGSWWGGTDTSGETSAAVNRN